MAKKVILQRSWPWKVKVIGKINGTIVFRDLKYINLNNKIVILSALVKKIMIKYFFLRNGGQRNTYMHACPKNIIGHRLKFCGPIWKQNKVHK